jgi:DNA polymerase III sliding clamp (beta) subunit (PCNA family)
VGIDGATFSFPTGATVDAGHDGAAADFPALPAGFATRATVDRDILATVAGPAAVSASPVSAGLPVLEAARVSVGHGQIVAMATDRYRLADTAAGPADGELVALIPARWLAASVKLLGPGLVAISTDGRGHVALERDGARLFATLVDGDYPRAVEAIADTAADAPVRLTADRRALLEATRGAVAALGKNEPVHLELDGHALHVTAGASSWKLMVDGNGAWVAAFNPTFLRDILATLTGERVILRQAMPTKPASLTAAGPARFTIQPFRL